MKVSNNLFEFHKLCEGVHNKAYLDPVGILTIGIGHANQDVESFSIDSVWSDEKIKNVWLKDVAEAERIANEVLDGAEVPQQYFDALVDIIFNTGAKPRTIVKYLKLGALDAARAELLRWIYSQGVVFLGLVKRRFTMFAYCSNDSDWLDLASVPLSSKNLNTFNDAISKYNYRIEAVTSKEKFVIVKC